jgi:hypothetical protein
MSEKVFTEEPCFHAARLYCKQITPLNTSHVNKICPIICLRHMGFLSTRATDEYMREFNYPKDLHSGEKMSNEIHLNTWKPKRFLQNIPYLSEH